MNSTPYSRRPNTITPNSDRLNLDAPNLDASNLDGPDLDSPALESDAGWLDRLTPVDAETLRRARAALTLRAQQEGLVDIAYRALETPIGSLLLAATEQGLVRVAFELENHDQVLERLARLVSPRILLAPGRLDQAARQLEEYFSGRRRRFDLTLDLRLAHGFRREVLVHLGEIRYGSTESYGQVARATGHPRAVRAVGSACATNPLPVVVPCHRVVRTDGALGGYLGGLSAKRTLLDLETAI